MIEARLQRLVYPTIGIPRAVPQAKRETAPSALSQKTKAKSIEIVAALKGVKPRWGHAPLRG